jgi:hypothetical protein
MARLGSGFTPDSVIQEAKAHVVKIQNLVEEMDRIRHYPKDAEIPVRYAIEGGCCPRK